MGSLSDYGLVALSETYTLGREELALLRDLGNKVFENLRANLPRLGVSIGITIPSVKVSTLGEVLAAVPLGLVVPVRFGVRAGGLLAMSSALKGLAMQMVFGGTKGRSGSEQLTDLELAAVGKLLSKGIAQSFSAGFARVFGAEAATTGAFAAEMMAAEPLLAQDKAIVLSTPMDRGGSTMVAAIELSPMMAARGRLKEATNPAPFEPEQSAPAIKRVGWAKVELSAVLGSFETSFANLSRIKPGSYIPLGKLKDSMAAAEIYANNRRLALAVVVEERGWRRVLIQDQPED